ncbi:hypothetical protein AHAS_Ahas09G0084500 [Arachis hypogaea]
MDGAADKNSSIAECGDLLRNHLKRWVADFMVTIEKCTAYIVELWDIYHGLKVAWDIEI